MDLQELREKIDHIDDQVLDLFVRRMEVSKAIGQYKRLNNLPIVDAEREREHLIKLAKKVEPEFRSGAMLLFSTVMDISKSVQYGEATDDALT